MTADTDDAHELIRQLRDGLDARPRPEDVAGIVMRLLPLGKAERIVVGRAASAAERRWGHWSSMSTDWDRPVDASHALGNALTALVDVVDEPLLAGLRAADPNDPDAIRSAALPVADAIGWVDAPDDAALPTRDRKDRLGIDVSMRRWRRALRHTGALLGRADALEFARTRRELAVTSRAGAFGAPDADRMAADPDAAAFVAYYAAKRNLRRAFTLSDTDNPFDEVAAVLFDRLGEDSDWAMVAEFYPAVRVLRRLTPEVQGQLVGRYWSLMRTGAGLAARAIGPVDRSAMVVRQGCDSDTFNLAAGAVNTARSAWIRALVATGSLDVLDAACPPKTPRVMAGDLFMWRKTMGEDPVHPDVKVAALLPPAWEVLDGSVSCTRADVEAACAAVGIDPESTGWAAPRPPVPAGTFSPTPEMVHGIVISDPVLAEVLRRGGAFSGRPVDPEMLRLLDHFYSDMPGRDAPPP